jgi:hypothetical protein
MEEEKLSGTPPERAIEIKIFTYNKMEEEKFYSVKEGMLSSPYYPRKIQSLRERRNELLQATDFYLLPDVGVSEDKLNKVKIYRQELRDFINRLLNDEIKCNLIDDAFEEKYFPKLIGEHPPSV